MQFSSRFRKRQSEPNFVTIVSGLPRSGTSMMMKMLQAGGMEILTDGVRAADEDNPKGYYEFERAKKLREGDVAWVEDAQGKVVKAISALLEYLPQGYDYKIIFMRRSIEEVLRSQKQMLIRRGEPTDKVSDDDMAKMFQAHLAKVEAWLSAQKNIQVLDISYNELLSDPQPHVDSVINFLGLPLYLQAMLDVPDKSLYRQRK